MAVWILTGALLALALLALALLAAGAHTGLTALRSRVASAWTHLDAQLRHRCDLVLALNKRTSGFSAHASDLLQGATAAAQAALAAPGIPDRAEAENGLTESLHGFFAFADTDPDLRTETALLAFERELSTSEERIAAARESYNDHVMGLNTRRHRFPWRLMAARFSPAEYFIIDDPAHR
jgi:LemA protein